MREPTSERFVAKENDQLLKHVKPQEVNSLVQTPWSDDPASGNRLRTCLQNLETLEKKHPIYKVCKVASFWKRVSIEMSYKTIADVGDGFVDRTPACREYTLHREDKSSRTYATIPGQNRNGPDLKVHIIQYLGINGIEIRIPSTTTKDWTSSVVICRGKNRYVEELHLNDPDHCPTSFELVLETSVAKEREPGSA